jgi:hypothetical protein
MILADERFGYQYGPNQIGFDPTTGSFVLVADHDDHMLRMITSTSQDTLEAGTIQGSSDGFGTNAHLVGSMGLLIVGTIS